MNMRKLHAVRYTEAAKMLGTDKLDTRKPVFLVLVENGVASYWGTSRSMGQALDVVRNFNERTKEAQ